MTPHVERHPTVGDTARDIVIGMGKEYMSQCPSLFPEQITKQVR
jgi:hypothetical protein